MMSDKAAHQKSVSVWRSWWGLIKANPRVYFATAFLRITIFGFMFQATGLLQREFFNALTGDALLGWEPWTWAGESWPPAWFPFCG